MASTTNDSNKSTSETAAKPAVRKTTSNRNGKSAAGSNGKSKTSRSKAAPKSNKDAWSVPEVPTWVGVAASVLGAGLAAGFLAWRHKQNGGSWGDDFNAAFANGETDSENFDQTRNAGPNSMRDDQDDWEEVDELSDASFPASDPPSFNPGTA